MFCGISIGVEHPTLQGVRRQWPRHLKTSFLNYGHPRFSACFSEVLNNDTEYNYVLSLTPWAGDLGINLL